MRMPAIAAIKTQTLSLSPTQPSPKIASNADEKETRTALWIPSIPLATASIIALTFQNLNLPFSGVGRFPRI